MQKSKTPLIDKVVKDNGKKRKKEVTLMPMGFNLPVDIKEKIRKCLMDGHYQISEIADKFATTRKSIVNILEKDSLLREIWETNVQKRVDAVENAMFDEATKGRGIAAQNAREFILSHNRKDIYSDNFASSNILNSLPKIIVAPYIVRDAEEQTENQTELPTIKSESPLTEK